MSHSINKMPQCHNPLITLSLVATKCHTNATLPHAHNLLIFNAATVATSATSFFDTYVYKKNTDLRTAKSPVEEHFLPQGSGYDLNK